MAFDKSRSAGYLINHLGRIFARALAAEIQPLGLAPGQFVLLLELWRENGLTQGELVRRLEVEQATVANTLARMERDGLIERRPHPEDGRAQSVHLTARGRALEGPATAAAAGINRKLLGGLSAAEREAFLETMRRLIAGRHPA